MNPLVSILIPVYNKGAFLSNCLEAVCKQSYTNLEIILVEDCSSDGSASVCARFASEDQRIRLIFHERNRGASAARNTALKASTGEWISYVDADDIPDTKMIEKLIDVALRTNSDIAVCGFTYITPEGEKLGCYSVPEETIVWEGKDCLARLVQLFPISSRVDIALWNKLYRRTVVEGITMPDLCSEDYVFNVEAFLRANRIVHFSESLYTVVHSPNSISRQPLSKKTITAIEANRIVFDRCLKERPDTAPAALERLITQCGDFSVLSVKNCSMDRKDAQRTIRHVARRAYLQAFHFRGTEATRACRRQLINLVFPRLHDLVDKVYSRLMKHIMKD